MASLRKKALVRVVTAWIAASTGMPLLYAESNSKWPTFLGVGLSHTGDGNVAPIHWDSKTNVAWVTKLQGYGQSSPIVWENDVYLTCIDGPMKDVNRVHCVDLNTGTVRWTHNASTKNLIPNDDYHSRGAMSPVADATLTSPIAAESSRA